MSGQRPSGRYASRRDARRSLLKAIAVFAFVGWFVGPASAHEGPPFPIFVDQPLDGYMVSVWADPDIGEAEFFVVIESPNGECPDQAPLVSMWVEPISGRLERVTYEMTQQSLRNRMQFEAQPHFDQQDMWTVGFQVTTGGATPQELTTTIESTPPGYGPWDLAIYLFPFALLGGMWALAMVRRQRIKRNL